MNYSCAKCDREFNHVNPFKFGGKTICNNCYTIISRTVQIPIKPMPTITPLEGIEKYKQIGESIGKLVDEKNKAYGDSFNKSAEFLKILYPNGVPVEHYSDMLGIIRVFDKLMRIATNKDALGENPWKDICGYSILRSDINE